MSDGVKILLDTKFPRLKEEKFDDSLSFWTDFLFVSSFRSFCKRLESCLGDFLRFMLSS